MPEFCPAARNLRKPWFSPTPQSNPQVSPLWGLAVPHMVAYTGCCTLSLHMPRTFATAVALLLCLRFLFRPGAPRILQHLTSRHIEGKWHGLASCSASENIELELDGEVSWALAQTAHALKIQCQFQCWQLHTRTSQACAKASLLSHRTYIAASL